MAVLDAPFRNDNHSAPTQLVHDVLSTSHQHCLDVDDTLVQRNVLAGSWSPGVHVRRNFFFFFCKACVIRSFDMYFEPTSTFITSRVWMMILHRLEEKFVFLLFYRRQTFKKLNPMA